MKVDIFLISLPLSATSATLVVNGESSTVSVPKNASDDVDYQALGSNLQAEFPALFFSGLGAGMGVVSVSSAGETSLSVSTDSGSPSVTEASHTIKTVSPEEYAELGEIKKITTSLVSPTTYMDMLAIVNPDLYPGDADVVTDHELKNSDSFTTTLL